MNSSKIKIGFDISQVAHPGGVGQYTRKLAEYLNHNSSINSEFLYLSLRKPYQGKLEGVKEYKIPPTVFEVLFNDLRFLSIERLIGEVDIFHSSDWTQPPTKAKKVTTYHDVVPLMYPEWSNPKIVSVHQKRMKIVEKEIDLVIAVSEATKKDLLEVSNIPSEKIIVIYEGVGEEFKPQDKYKVEEFRSKYNLPDKFVLSIGGIGKRRNLEAIQYATEGLNLVISNKDIPYLSPEELPLLYAASSLLLYPSFYEGFGLPILEAMATGTPVITSNVSSMPEIAGDAAILVDPNDKDKIREVVREVLNNQKLAKSLQEKGFKRAAAFSWEKCGEETVKAYKSLLNV